MERYVFISIVNRILRGQRKRSVSEVFKEFAIMEAPETTPGSPSAPIFSSIPKSFFIPL